MYKFHPSVFDGNANKHNTVNRAQRHFGARKTRQVVSRAASVCWTCLPTLKCKHGSRISNELSAILCDSCTDNLSVASILLSKLLYDAFQANVVAGNVFFCLSWICKTSTKLNKKMIIYIVSNLRQLPGSLELAKIGRGVSRHKCAH